VAFARARARARESGRLRGDARERAYGREYLRYTVASERERINNAASPVPVYIYTPVPTRGIYVETLRRLWSVVDKSFNMVIHGLQIERSLGIINIGGYSRMVLWFLRRTNPVSRE